MTAQGNWRLSRILSAWCLRYRYLSWVSVSETIVARLQDAMWAFLQSSTAVVEPYITVWCCPSLQSAEIMSPCFLLRCDVMFRESFALDGLHDSTFHSAVAEIISSDDPNFWCVRGSITHIM